MPEAPWYPPKNPEIPMYKGWAGLHRQTLHLGSVWQRRQKLEVHAALVRFQELRSLPDADLELKLRQCQGLFRCNGHIAQGQTKDLRHVREEALALIAIALERSLSMTPYPVQMQAALAMYDGFIVQMAPGEGKTLSIAMAAVLYGWSGHPVHIMTANDYLARRDAEQMSPMYQFCGLSAGFLLPEMDPAELTRQYGSAIVYATGKQVLADYLRDQLILLGANDPLRRQLWLLRQKGLAKRTPVMRGLYTALVDEADSVLIDEATTPLIISAPEKNPMLTDAVTIARSLVDALEKGRDYLDPEHTRDVRFTEEGEKKLAALTPKLPPLWRVRERCHDLLAQAIMARDVFQRDRHYVIDEDKVVIIDENTGRMMPGRSWSYGLHQAIEAREGVEITHPSQTLARMSFQRFFCHYHRLAGASGTLQGIERELWRTYGLLTLRIPHRLPSRLRVKPYRHFPGRSAKLAAVLEETRRLHDSKLPVLLGTRRISDSEILAECLRDQGLHCDVLNAKEHLKEAEIIAMAGQAGRITVATNMAGRGTDIHVLADMARKGGLQVLMLEPHESARVDWQLFGRAGRQGAPGCAQPFVALDDDLLRRHLPFWLKPLYWLADIPIFRGACIRLLLPLAQQQAQWQAWFMRKQIMKREKLLNEQLSFAGEEDLAADLLLKR